MKRPLCVIAAMIAAAVWLLLLLIPQEEYSCVPDRAHISRTGKVTRKENRIKSDSGEQEGVVYIFLPEEDTTVVAYLSPDEEPQIGTYVQIEGQCRQFKCARNPGEFDSRDYYRILKISYRITDAKVKGTYGSPDSLREGLYRLRCYFEGNLDKCLNEQDAGIMKAVLLGDKNELDDEIKDIYKRNGVIHVIAISGVHISLIGMTLYKLLRKTSLWLIPSAVVSIVVMYLYGVMCGMSTSAFRAILMFSVRLLADMIGRTYDMLSALSLAAIMLLIEQPLYIRHSGFLMSFGAILAIGYILPAFPEVIQKGKLKFISAPLAISLVTFPVYISCYYTFPVYSIVINLMIIPLVSLLMLFGILCIVLGGFFGPLGVLVGYVDHFILKWFLLCCNAGDMLPGNIWYIGAKERWQIAVYLVALIIFVAVMHYKDRIANVVKTEEKIVNIARYAVLVAGFLILCIRIKPPLKITAVDVGQGDGIVIETNDFNCMIDGGSTSKTELAKYSLIPFLSHEGIGALDAVILTHEDEDHMSGILEMMDTMGQRQGNIRIKNLILPNIDEVSKGDNYKSLVKRAEELSIPVSYIKQGDEISLGGSVWDRQRQGWGSLHKGMTLKCIGPVSGMITNEPNAYSTILLLKYGNFSALFTGDVEGSGQDNLKTYIRENPDEFSDLTLLKVAHHGSEYTTDEEFLNLIKPRISLISCGENNRYGHPHEALVDRLEAVETMIYRTDQGGAITINVSRNRISVDTFL